MATDEKPRPVLWEGDFECGCGYKARAEVLGRRGHRYDELEIVEVPEDQVTPEEAAADAFVTESYTAEGRGVLDVLACPKCGKRPGLRRELRRIGLWILVLLVMSSLVAALLYFTHEELAAKAALLATGITILGRAYVFISAMLEAKERVRLTDR